jgi:hypothetical protein
MTLMTANDGMGRITASHKEHKIHPTVQARVRCGFIFTDGISKTIFAAFEVVENK